MTTDENPEETDQTSDEGRRDFIKKLPYVAPVIQTFLLSEGVLAGGKQRGNQKNQRRKKGVSPNPGKGNPPPPPPKKGG